MLMNSFKTNNWPIKLSGGLGLVGVILLLSFPGFSRPYYYPSSSRFQPFGNYFQSHEDDPCFDITDNLDIIDNLKSNICFETLAVYLEQAGLSDILKQNRTFTLFAPTDEAFKALPPDIRKKLEDRETLKKVLQYHVVAGFITETDIQQRKIVTLEGSAVEISGIPIGDNIGVKLNEANANDPVAAKNGVVIPIDKVLLPPSF